MKAVRAVAAAILTLVGCSKAPPAVGEIVGEVVDQQGKPVQGARVGIVWTVYESSPVSGATTSAEGRFRVPIPESRSTKGFFPQSLMVLDARSQTGILKPVPEEEISKSQKCVLEPLVKVTIKWKLDDLPVKSSKGTVEIWAGYGGTLMSSPWKGDDVVLMLPSGTYKLSVQSSWDKGFTNGGWDVKVVSGAGEMLVGPLELKHHKRSSSIPW